jgi:hypothetical protein
MSETAGVGVEALDQLLDRTRQALEAAGSGVVVVSCRWCK